MLEDVVTGHRGRGRPKRRYINGVKEVLTMRGVGDEVTELPMSRFWWKGWCMGQDGDHQGD